MHITAQELGRAKPVPPEKVEMQTLQTRKCHLGLAGGEGSPRASSRTHFTAENVQTTSDVEIVKVKEPMNSLDAKGTLIPKANYALVKAALQTAPEELAVEAPYRQHQSERFASSRHPPPTAWLGLAGTNALLLTVVSSGFVQKNALGSYSTWGILQSMLRKGGGAGNDKEIP